jgi:hypothetical protein
MVEEGFEKKLNCWKAKYLSYGGRLIMKNSVLRSHLMFMMSFFEIPKGVIKILEFFRYIFYWQGGKIRRNIASPNGKSYVVRRIRVLLALLT